MTGTPLSLAETPDRGGPGGPDLLSEMLAAVRLTGMLQRIGGRHKARRRSAAGTLQERLEQAS